MKTVLFFFMLLTQLLMAQSIIPISDVQKTADEQAGDSPLKGQSVTIAALLQV